MAWTRDPHHKSRTYTHSRSLGYDPAKYMHSPVWPSHFSTILAFWTLAQEEWHTSCIRKDEYLYDRSLGHHFLNNLWYQQFNLGVVVILQPSGKSFVEFAPGQMRFFRNALLHKKLLHFSFFASKSHNKMHAAKAIQG